MRVIPIEGQKDFSQLFEQIKKMQKYLGLFHGLNNEELSIFFKTKEKFIVGVRINKKLNTIEVFSKNNVNNDVSESIIEAFSKKLSVLLFRSNRAIKNETSNKKKKAVSSSVIEMSDVVTETVKDEPSLIVKQEKVKPLKSEEITTEKLQKLREIKELLDMEAINQDEFEKLKVEILTQSTLPAPKANSMEKTITKSLEEERFDEKVQSILPAPKAKNIEKTMARSLEEERLVETVTEPFAVITLITSIIGFFIFPAVFYLLCFIASFISYFRIKSEEKYKGTGLRITGYIFLIAGVWYTSYFWGCKWYEIFTYFYFGG